jgi:hypothetical protein
MIHVSEESTVYIACPVHMTTRKWVETLGKRAEKPMKERKTDEKKTKEER